MLTLAGEADKRCGERYTKSFMIQKLQEAKEILGRTPPANVMDSMKGFPGYNTYQGYFGSWNEALKAAGFEPYVVESEIKELSEGEAMYVAACIDTDGSVSMQSNNGHLELKVGIWNNHVEFLRHIQRVVRGGYFTEHKRNKEMPSFVKTNNRQFCLIFRRNEVKDLLPQIIPFLIIKKKKAKRALKVLENRKCT